MKFLFSLLLIWICGSVSIYAKPREISKQKCKEYSKYATDEKGIKSCEHKISKRVVGGTNAGRLEFPHMAALGYPDKLRNTDEILFRCGGSIINEMFILTASVCLQDLNNVTVEYALIGVTNLKDTDHRQLIKVAERIFHPLYKSRIAEYDIGLIKLEKSIEFSVYARPACLYSETKLGVDKAIATGWGTTKAFGNTSEDLQKVTLSFLDSESCTKNYSKVASKQLPNGIREEFYICTFESGGKDTCSGDSGGPLQIEHATDDIKCMYDIVGITSFGRGCGSYPSVYTRVSYYIDWIEKTVWPDMI